MQLLLIKKKGLLSAYNVHKYCFQVNYLIFPVVGMVSIPSKHLREVSDPVGELLSQLHKIVYLAKVS